MQTIGFDLTAAQPRTDDGIVASELALATHLTRLRLKAERLESTEYRCLAVPSVSTT